MIKLVGIMGIAVGLCGAVQASLDWERTSINLKVHPLQASEKVEFKFINTGTEPIRILEVKPTCGCLSGRLDKKDFASGESGVVHVVFNLQKREGPQRKAMSIRTSDNPRKPLMLYVSTNIPPTFKPSCKRLTWNANEDRTPKSFHITNRHRDPFRLAAATPAREGLEVELKTIREGYEYELIVKPSSDLKSILIPIIIHPAKPSELDQVKTFTVYALVK